MAEHVQGTAAGGCLQASLGKVREHSGGGREGQSHECPKRLIGKEKLLPILEYLVSILKCAKTELF